MNRSNQDTRQSVTLKETVTMDSRKFLQILNNSAESQIVFFEDAVEKLGNEYGRNWQLHATMKDRIIIEDVDTNEYILADYLKEKNKVNISNLRKIEIMEGEKSPIFESACQSLIDGLASADHKGTEAALSKIAACRFRSKVIPDSGMIKTKDGVVRKIVTHDNVMTEDELDALSQAIFEDITDKVTINEGSVSGSFNVEQIQLPVSELTNRRVRAWGMREVARNAYTSKNFQTLAEAVASAICKGDEAMKKMVEPTAKFLTEHQEFSLLTSEQMNEVVGNALAAKAYFNEMLAEDTATFISKINIKTNRTDIIDSWKKTAKLVNNPVMMENVMLLEQAEEKNFQARNDEFLGTIFEGLDTTKSAASHGLKLLSEKLTDPKLKEQVVSMLSKLETNADDATVMEALSLLSKTNSQQNALKNFDANPAIDEVLDEPVAPPDAAIDKIANPPAQSPAGTVININTGSGAPTISDNSVPAAPAAPAPEAEGNDDLISALDKIDVPEAPATPAPEEPKLESVTEKPTVETNTDDEFVLPEGVITGEVNNDYGTPILSEYILNQKVKDLTDLITKQNVREEDIQNKIGDFAGAVLADDPSLKDPKKMEEAKKMLIGAYSQNQAEKQRGDTLPEDQYKSPTKVYRRRGLKRSSINRLAEGKFELLKNESDAVLAKYKGVHFVIDRGDPPAILNTDASIELVIPEGMVSGALYLAECNDTEADANAFVEWLDQNIEQLRPLSEDEDKQITEAVARISINPGDTLEVTADLGGAAPSPEGTPAALDQTPVLNDAPLDQPIGMSVPVDGPVGDEPPVSPDGPVGDEPVGGDEPAAPPQGDEVPAAAAVDEPAGDGEGDEDEDEEEELEESASIEELEKALSQIITETKNK